MRCPECDTDFDVGVERNAWGTTCPHCEASVWLGSDREVAYSKPDLEMPQIRDPTGIVSGRVRVFAVFMLGNGAIISLLPFFGLTLSRFGDASPAVVTGAGLFVMLIGVVALAFSFTERSAKAGILFAKIFLCSIIVLSLLGTVVVIITVWLSY